MASNPGDASALSPMERRVLVAYSDGYGRVEIARRFRLSPRTVSQMLTVAKEKLGSRSLTHAAVVLRLMDAGCEP